KEKTTVTPSDLLWLYIILPLVLVALVTAVVVFVLLKKSKGNKTEKNSSDVSLQTVLV
ncbi:hypothetical protein ATANTOWER_031803, partial [Ataeniobius toweri]|nr:hypothetical protein [Ataeniobius toweri]